MTETVPPSPGAPYRPGVVILAAVLNFMAASVVLIGLVLSVTALAFSGVLSFADYVAAQVSQISAQANVAYGVNFLLVMLSVVCLTMFLYFLFLGIGLLRGWKAAWFGQLVMSVMGLTGFPVGTALNAVIIYLLFRRDTRGYFGI